MLLSLHLKLLLREGNPCSMLLCSGRALVTDDYTETLVMALRCRPLDVFLLPLLLNLCCGTNSL